MLTYRHTDSLHDYNDLGIRLNAVYQRAGPLKTCKLNGNRYYIQGDDDGWFNPWDLILVSVTLTSESGNTTERLYSKASGAPKSDNVVQKHPSSSLCRQIRTNHFVWNHPENSLRDAAESMGGDIVKFDLNFKIQYISQANHTERIKKYNLL